MHEISKPKILPTSSMLSLLIPPPQHYPEKLNPSSSLLQVEGTQILHTMWQNKILSLLPPFQNYENKLLANLQMQKFTSHNVKSYVTCSKNTPTHFQYQSFLKLGGFCLVFTLRIMTAVLHEVKMQSKVLKRNFHQYNLLYFLVLSGTIYYCSDFQNNPVFFLDVLLQYILNRFLKEVQTQRAVENYFTLLICIKFYSSYPPS